jgi:hypothetical protein
VKARADFSLRASLDQMAGRHPRAAEDDTTAIAGGHIASPAQAAELWPIELPAVQFIGSAAPAIKALWGPNTGYAWAIQRLTVGGLGGTDSLLVYRGYSGAADVQPQNLVGPPLTAAAPNMFPGKSGLILMPDQSLVFGGTLTGASTYTVSGNAVQVTLDRLSRFLE